MKHTSSYFSIKTRLKLWRLQRKLKTEPSPVWNDDHTAKLSMLKVKVVSSENELMHAYLMYTYEEFDENNRCIYELKFGCMMPIIENWYKYDNDGNIIDSDYRNF